MLDNEQTQENEVLDEADPNEIDQELTPIEKLDQLYAKSKEAEKQAAQEAKAKKAEQAAKAEQELIDRARNGDESALVQQIINRGLVPPMASAPKPNRQPVTADQAVERIAADLSKERKAREAESKE